jgi:UDP-N-acetylglucosamine 4-epimerase
MSAIFKKLKLQLSQQSQPWLVTGAAGFIGSHLIESLLRLEQDVVGLDNFATGHQSNLDDVRSRLTEGQWSRFRFQAGDITRLDDCRRACAGRKYVLHQAALGSVPRSIADPLATHASNVDGFINMLVAARDAGVSRFVYASSSSVYGDHPGLPKIEKEIGRPLSPYAATKLVDEIYAATFHRSYGLPVIGLRYFNVFGPRQDPNGAYAAVIPKWFAAAAQGTQVVINGDGETSRDFCYIANVVQANLLAATASREDAVNQVYNIAVGHRTTLNELFEKIRSRVARTRSVSASPIYQPERPGDVRHSHANIELAKALLGYEPTHDIDQGLEEAGEWYLRQKS